MRRSTEQAMEWLKRWNQEDVNELAERLGKEKAPQVVTHPKAQV